MRPRGSIISQVLVAFSAFAVLIAVAAVVGYTGLANQNSATKQLTGRDYVLEDTAGEMEQDFTISQLAISSFALSGHPSDLGPLPPRPPSPRDSARSGRMLPRTCAASSTPRPVPESSCSRSGTR